MPRDNIFNQSKRLLNELQTVEVQDFHYVLEDLLEELENKPDPEMYEVHLVENIYQYLEKLKTMEANLNKYVNNNYKNLTGNKIYDLNEKSNDDYYEEV